MAWQRNYVVLKTGQRVRYALLEREDSKVYFVRFRGQGGTRLEKSTGATKKHDAIGAAHQLILEEYEQIVLTSETIDWETAATRLASTLKAHGNRPKTITGYIETLNKLRAVFPLAKGPIDISERHAADFKTKYGGGTFSRRRKVKEGETAPTYSRKGKSLDSRIRTLKAVFEHFRTMTPPLVESNPFAAVTLPKLDKEVKYVTKTDVADVFRWFDERYPGWAMPKLFFRVKALTASRLDDLCSLLAKAICDGGILFSADIAKQRKERFAKLPDDVYAELAAYRGPKWVWEKYPAELKAANQRLGVPTHRQNLEFAPRRLYLWVVQIMQTYQQQTGNEFSSHDFRKAAFTRAAEKDLHPKKVATGFGVTPETMLRYYTAVDQRKASEEVGAELADDLDPTKQ